MKYVIHASERADQRLARDGDARRLFNTWRRACVGAQPRAAAPGASRFPRAGRTPTNEFFCRKQGDRAFYS
jgi:hypothetical protein